MKWFSRTPTVISDKDSNSYELDRIKSLLFPAMEKEVTEDGTEFIVDRSIDSNLYAVLVDLQEGFCDEVVLKSIKDAIEVLEQIRKILNVEQEIPNSSDMYVLGPPEK